MFSLLKLKITSLLKICGFAAGMTAMVYGFLGQGIFCVASLAEAAALYFLIYLIDPAISMKQLFKLRIEPFQADSANPQQMLSYEEQWLVQKWKLQIIASQALVFSIPGVLSGNPSMAYLGLVFGTTTTLVGIDFFVSNIFRRNRRNEDIGEESRSFSVERFNWQADQQSKTSKTIRFSSILKFVFGFAATATISAIIGIFIFRYYLPSIPKTFLVSCMLLIYIIVFYYQAVLNAPSLRTTARDTRKALIAFSLTPFFFWHRYFVCLLLLSGSSSIAARMSEFSAFFQSAGTEVPLKIWHMPELITFFLTDIIFGAAAASIVMKIAFEFVENRLGKILSYGLLGLIYCVVTPTVEVVAFELLALFAYDKYRHLAVPIMIRVTFWLAIFLYILCSSLS